MSEKQIKEYYERIEKLLNGANKETYGFAPQEIKNILRSYEELQNQNQELKKQLEEYKATNEVLSHELTKDKLLQQDCLTTCCGIPIGDIPKLITQQKEFIEYMNKTIEELEYDDVDDEEMKGYLIQRIDTFKEILQKYRSIIGCDKVE